MTAADLDELDAYITRLRFALLCKRIGYRPP